MLIVLPSLLQFFNTKTNILFGNGNTIMNEKSTLLLKSQGKLIIIVSIMLIILLNIILVFNDDRFGLFLTLIYFSSSCYIFV